MARARSIEQKPKSKVATVDDLNRGIEKLKDLMAQVEDLSREGFPYREAVRARTELSLRESIRRIFGEKSEEYHNHKGHKLCTSNRTESAQTIAVLKQLMAQLEQQKLEHLGVKPASTEPPPAVQRDPDTPLSTAAPVSIPSPGTQPAVGASLMPPIRAATLPDTSTASVGTPTDVPSASATSTSAPEETRTVPAGQAIPYTPENSQPAAVSSVAHKPASHQTGPPGEAHQRVGQDSIQVEPTSPGGIAHPPPIESPPADRHVCASGPQESLSEPCEPHLATVISPAQPQTDPAAPGTPPITPPTPVSSSDPGALPAASPSPVQGPVGTEQPSPVLPSGSIPSSGAVRPPQQAESGASQRTRLPIATPATSDGRPPTPVLTRDRRATDQAGDPGPTVQHHQVSHLENLSRESSGLARALPDPAVHPEDPLATLRKICSRFHLVARQLRLRRDYRATLEIEDEFDVQDLLYALLRLEFEEVGNEDWSPSYGDGATRTSYLLPKEQVVIVAKKTKLGVSIKELMEQVRVDSTHFSGRADCRRLVCFIYDPEGRVGNPRGLESDFTMVGDAFTLEVIIAPK